MWTENFQVYNLDWEKAEEPEMKLPTSVGSIGSVFRKKQGNSRKTSTSASLTMWKSLTVRITRKLWKILQEMGIPDHLTCLLRNLYAGQEAKVRTGHGATDWFQIGKGLHQGCILSLFIKSCLFIGDGQGGLSCCSPWGHRVGHNWATELNWTVLLNLTHLQSFL